MAFVPSGQITVVCPGRLLGSVDPSANLLHIAAILPPSVEKPLGDEFPIHTIGRGCWPAGKPCQMMRADAGGVTIGVPPPVPLPQAIIERAATAAAASFSLMPYPTPAALPR